MYFVWLTTSSDKRSKHKKSRS
ncbi:hypothetical protein MED222_05285 [Vibrio sp. MED222]|nr:hypothetical protein MED222_05285 [Vibrio sp. MED222]